MEVEKTINSLTLNFVDAWNDENPTERLTEELIEKVRLHINYAYVAGIDKVSMRVANILDAEQKKVRTDGTRRSSVSINFLRELIFEL